MRAKNPVNKGIKGLHLMALGTRDLVKVLAPRSWLGGWNMADLSLELGQ